jgi:hypothetical protein
MSFKSFDLAHDVGSVLSAVNEVLTISSSLFGSPAGDPNIKTYQNISSGSLTTPLGGYWQTVFDSSPSSIQSTALFDITFGFASSSDAGSYYHKAKVGTSVSSSYQEKNKVYREMASILLGSADQTFTINNVDAQECFFIMVKRGIMKDELKKGVVVVSLSGSTNGVITGSDIGAGNSYKQTVGGDYAWLLNEGNQIGQVWYNAGIIVIPATAGTMPWSVASTTRWSGSLDGAAYNLDTIISSGTIDELVTGFRSHLENLAFQNQTNLYSTIYFCRATNTEFNYSSNPTFIDGSQRIIVTSGSNIMQSRTYITKVGLYDANDNLLAVGSVNKPITKSPDTESIYRIRLDY